MAVAYDRWQWHVEGVFPKDARPEQGFVHIGLYLTWLILSGRVDLDWWQRRGLLDDVAAVRERRQTGCELREAVDGTLSSEMLSAEGAGFSDAYYAVEGGYLHDYQRTFGQAADRYAVPDSWEAYDRIGEVIDRRFAEWVEAGRPEQLSQPPAIPRFVEGLLGFVRRRWQ